MIPVFWAIIIALVTGISSFLISNITGPQDVRIVNERVGADTIFVMSDRKMNAEPQGKVSSDLKSKILEYIELHEATEPVTLETTPINPVARPKYLIPSTVRGYTEASLAPFASIECPDVQIQAMDVFETQIDLFQQDILSIATPLFVRIIGIDPAGRRTQHLQEQYLMLSGMNRLLLAALYPYGNYEVVIGFYFIEEMNESYPPFYSATCGFQIGE